MFESDEIFVEEWRPVECQKLHGEIVRINNRSFLKVKCQKCSKLAGHEVFHYLGVEGSTIGRPQ